MNELERKLEDIEKREIVHRIKVLQAKVVELVTSDRVEEAWKSYVFESTKDPILLDVELEYQLALEFLERDMFEEAAIAFEHYGKHLTAESEMDFTEDFFDWRDVVKTKFDEVYEINCRTGKFEEANKMIQALLDAGYSNLRLERGEE